MQSSPPWYLNHSLALRTSWWSSSLLDLFYRFLERQSLMMSVSFWYSQSFVVLIIFWLLPSTPLWMHWVHHMLCPLLRLSVIGWLMSSPSSLRWIHLQVHSHRNFLLRHLKVHRSRSRSRYHIPLLSTLLAHHLLLRRRNIRLRALHVPIVRRDLMMSHIVFRRYLMAMRNRLQICKLFFRRALFPLHPLLPHRGLLFSLLPHLWHLDRILDMFMHYGHPLHPLHKSLGYWIQVLLTIWHLLKGFSLLLRLLPFLIFSWGITLS